MAAVATAQADVVFDTFDVDGGFHPTDNLVAAHVRDDSFGVSASRAAARFTVSGGSFTLDSVTLPISVQRSPEDTNVLRVRLTEDAGGAPGTTLEVLSEDQDIWPTFSNPFTTTTTLPSMLNLPLLEGTRYWIVTEPTAIPAAEPPLDADFRWFHNTNGTTVLARQQGEADSLPADPWSGFVGQRALAFRVDGTPGATAVPGLEGPHSSPFAARLDPPFPNPFAAGTTIRFEIFSPTRVRAVVLDVSGRAIRTLAASAAAPAGPHSVRWDGRDARGRPLAAGAYFLLLEAGAGRHVRRVALSR